VAELTQKMNTQISRLQKDVDFLMKSTARQTTPSSPATVVKPKPQVNIDPPSPTVIQQVPLSN
jgi:hypothetical protein